MDWNDSATMTDGERFDASVHGQDRAQAPTTHSRNLIVARDPPATPESRDEREDSRAKP
jgi:hypothetical protein